MKKAASRTGNNAFTLIEVLLAVSVFAAGILFVFPSFLRSSDALNYLSGRYEGDLIAGNLLTGMEKRFRSERTLSPESDTGKIDSNGRVYAYRTSVNPVGDSRSVFELSVSLECKNGRPFRLDRKKIVFK